MVSATELSIQTRIHVLELKQHPHSTLVALRAAWQSV